MSNVTVVTLIRDGAGPELKALIDRLTSLKHKKRLRFVLVEGDSIDDTWGELLRWQQADNRVRLVKHDTGKARFGHVVSAERFEHLAGLVNAGIEMAIVDNWADYILVIPSDVAFESDLITRLLSRDKQLIAPMFWTEEGGGLRFYDTWAFSRNGLGFTPYNFTWYQTHFPSEPVEMDSVGGCVLARADLFRQGLRYSPVNLDRGLCEQVRAMGHTVWCDPTTHIVHL